MYTVTGRANSLHCGPDLFIVKSKPSVQFVVSEISTPTPWIIIGICRGVGSGAQTKRPSMAGGGGGGGGVIVRLFSGTTQSGYTGMYTILVFGTNKPTVAFQIWNPFVGYRTHHHVGGKKYLELQH